MNTCKSIEEYQDYELEKLRISSANYFKNISRYTSLWHLSLAYCNPLPSNITVLSKFQCLRFLDLSFTNVTFQILQTALRSTDVIQLHCLGCKSIQSVEGPPYNRGFLMFVLPNVWTLDGIFISSSERQNWESFFTRDIEGIYSTLMRKYKISQVLSFGHQYRVFGENSLSSHAKRWISKRPDTFRMAIDYDIWKLDKLASDFQEKIKRQMPVEFYNVAGSIESFLSFRNADQSERSLDNKCKFIAILTISLFSEIPSVLFQEALGNLFNNQAWTNESVSPIFWDAKLKLEYLGLLIGRMSVDMSSAVIHAGFRFPRRVIIVLRKIISLVMRSVYDKIISDYHMGQVQADSAADEVLLSYLTKFEKESFSILQIQLVEVLCSYTGDQTFNSHFPTIYATLLRSCSNLPDHKDELLWSDQEMIEILENANAMSREDNQVYAAERKLRLVLEIQRIYGTIQEIYYKDDDDLEMDIRVDPVKS